MHRAKKVVSDSPGLVDFAIGLVNSVLNFPDGQVKYFEEFNLQKNCKPILLIEKCWGLKWNEMNEWMNEMNDVGGWNDVWVSKC